LKHRDSVLIQLHKEWLSQGKTMDQGKLKKFSEKMFKVEPRGMMEVGKILGSKVGTKKLKKIYKDMGIDFSDALNEFEKQKANKAEGGSPSSSASSSRITSASPSKITTPYASPYVSAEPSPASSRRR